MQLSAEEKVALLLQISQQIRSTLDLDEILNLLLDMVQQVLQYDAAGIFIKKTAHLVVRGDVLQMRFFFVAHTGHKSGTARVKGAAGRTILGVRNGPLDGRQPLPRPTEAEQTTQQRLVVGPAFRAGSLGLVCSLRATRG